MAIAHESSSAIFLTGGRKPRRIRRGCCTPAPIISQSMRLAVLDLPEGNAMRAPGEAPG